MSITIIDKILKKQRSTIYGLCLLFGIFLGLVNSQHFAVAQQSPIADHPPLTPQHDSIIDYEFKLYPTVSDVRKGANENASGPLRHVRVYFGGQGDLTKIVYLDTHDEKIEIGSVVINRMNDTVTVIMNGRRSFIKLTNQEVSHKPFLLDLSMHFVLKNQNMDILGRPCKVWSVLSKQGTSEACVTDDGFVLKEDGMDMDGINGSLLAMHIDDTTLKPSDFDVPSGFHQVSTPK